MVNLWPISAVSKLKPPLKLKGRRLLGEEGHCSERATKTDISVSYDNECTDNKSCE